MNNVENNSLIGVKKVSSIFPEMDFNRPLTAKLYKSARKIQSVHTRRFVLLVPGFFTSLADSVVRILKVPVATAISSHKNLKKIEDKESMLVIQHGNKKITEKRFIKEFRKIKRERTIYCLSLPVSYVLVIIAGLVATTAISALDIAGSPIHTAWRASKM